MSLDRIFEGSCPTCGATDTLTALAQLVSVAPYLPWGGKQ